MHGPIKTVDCPVCHGSGEVKVLRYVHDAREGEDEFREECERCDGRGQVTACLVCDVRPPEDGDDLCAACRAAEDAEDAQLPTTLPGAARTS